MILKDAAGIVTGSSRGLGLALSKKLTDEGCRLLSEQLFLKSWPNAHDLSISYNAYLHVAEARSQLGKIDFLINNAGYAHPLNPIELINDYAVEQTFKNNVFTTINMMREVLATMKLQKSGLIINIASKCAISGRAVPKLAPYCASKAAILQLTEAVGKELKDTKVKVISVSPGGMNTDMRKKVYGEEDAKQQMDPAYIADYIIYIMKNSEHVPNGVDFYITKDQPVLISDAQKIIGWAGS